MPLFCDDFIDGLGGRQKAGYPAAMDEAEVWREAQKLLNEHGKGAALEAARRADGMLQAGDLAGSAVWLRIMLAITSLQMPDKGGPAH